MQAKRKAMCAVGVVAFVIAAAVVASPASAERPRRGGHDSKRGVSRPERHRSDKEHDGFRFSIKIGDQGVRFGTAGPRFHRPRFRCMHGYYTRVWVPPVYETRRRPCGRTDQVLVEDGYYKRVWVSANCGRRGHHGHYWGRHRSGQRRTGHPFEPPRTRGRSRY